MGAVKVLSITGVTILGGLFAIGLTVEPKTPEQRVADMHVYMAEAADQIKGQRVHENVIFDGYEIDGDLFTYNYTLTHIKDGQFNGMDKVRIQKMMHEKVCGDRKMKRFLRADGVVRYSYVDSDGSHLFIIAFDDAICGLA